MANTRYRRGSRFARGGRAGRDVGGQGEVADDGPRHRPPRVRRRGEHEARLDVDDGLGERCPEGPGRRRAGGRYARLPLRPSAARTQAADVHRRGGAGAARGEGEHGVDPVDGYVHVAGGQGQQPGGAGGAVAVGAGGAGPLAVRGEPDRPARHRDPDGLTGQRRRPAAPVPEPGAAFAADAPTTAVAATSAPARAAVAPRAIRIVARSPGRRSVPGRTSHPRESCKYGE